MVQYVLRMLNCKYGDHAEVTSRADTLRQAPPPVLQRAMDLAREKGASCWLTALPIMEHGFSLHKGAFRDALSLRYSWELSHIPGSCSCGKSFSVEHALSCLKGGFPSLRHNEIRNITATLMSEVCHDVSIEPPLQPLSGEHLDHASARTIDGAHLDIAASGFWGGRARAFFDVRVFNPYAPSNSQLVLPSIYRKHEREKKRLYDQRVREVEFGSFTPLVMSLTGGWGKEAAVCYKRLASSLSTKWKQPYSKTMGWLRCILSFSLLRSAIMCVRGTRSSAGHVPNVTSGPIDLIHRESLFSV